MGPLQSHHARLIVRSASVALRTLDGRSACYNRGMIAVLMAATLAALFHVTVPAIANAAPKPHASAKPTAKPRPKAKGVSVDPKSGPEGTAITITYPTPLPGYPLPKRALLRDPGVHGWVIMHGAGDWVQWDPRRNALYSAPAHGAGKSADRNTYKALVPYGICGIVIKAKQATVTKLPTGVIQSGITPVPSGAYPSHDKPVKTLEVWLDGQKGAHGKFGLMCDKYTLNVKAKADPTTVIVPPAGSSTVTATVTVKGPAQFLNGKPWPKNKKRPELTTPIFNVDVWYHTTFGTLAPNPAIVRTARDGTANATVSSGAPGVAVVQAVAPGLGDAAATVTFKKKEVLQSSPTPAPAAIAPLAAATHFHFDLSGTPVTSHNGTLDGSGWATQIRGGVSWNHIDDTITWRSTPITYGGDFYWDEWYWDDDLDYCWDDDFPDGQVARINLGGSYEHTSIIDSGFRYDANGFGFNTGFSLKSSPQVSEFGRITYFPTMTSTYDMPTGGAYQFSKQQYDFGVRYKVNPDAHYYLEGGFHDEIMLGKNSNGSSGGGIYNFGPFFGLGARF
jgi:hypothetical protein